MQKLVDAGTKIIALDVIENATVEHANMVLPAASFAESQGTLINNEGRAQRFFPVFPPAEQRLPSWQWLLQLAALSGNSQLAALTQFDQVVDACAASQPAFAHLNEVAPDGRFRDRGQKNTPPNPPLQWPHRDQCRSLSSRTAATRGPRNTVGI
jgi:NADH-quinone oxidoreductase subunit G